MALTAPIRDIVLGDDRRLTPIWQKYMLALMALEPRIDSLEVVTSFTGATPTAPPVYLSDTQANFANYPATSYPALSVFYVTDWTVFYINTGLAWIYLCGTYRAALASIPGTLGANDTGFLFQATDYFHGYIWAGGWVFQDGDTSGYIIAVPTAATPPYGGLWQLCDGTAVAVAKADGTTQSITTPNLTTKPILLGAANALVANDIQRTAGAAPGNSDTIGLDWYMRR